MSRSIERLRNLGPKSARMLAEVGIHSESDLRAVGAAEAYARLRLVSAHGLSLNALYAMYGALMDCDWRSLPPDAKAELRREVEAPKRRTSLS